MDAHVQAVSSRLLHGLGQTIKQKDLALQVQCEVTFDVVVLFSPPPHYHVCFSRVEIINRV